MGDCCHEIKTGWKVVEEGGGMMLAKENSVEVMGKFGSFKR